VVARTAAATNCAPAAAVVGVAAAAAAAATLVAHHHGHSVLRHAREVPKVGVLAVRLRAGRRRKVAVSAGRGLRANRLAPSRLTQPQRLPSATAQPPRSRCPSSACPLPEPPPRRPSHVWYHPGDECRRRRRDDRYGASRHSLRQPLPPLLVLARGDAQRNFVWAQQLRRGQGGSGQSEEWAQGAVRWVAWGRQAPG
jgi:hypothetical protein